MKETTPTEEARRRNPLAIEIIQEFEQLHTLKADGLVYPYLCPGGYPTIGWGRRVRSLDHPPITQEQAGTWLLEDIDRAEAAAWRLCPSLKTESEARQAAIIDFVYNLGAGRLEASTLRRRINENRWDVVPHELRRWVYSKGKILAGLVRRRNAAAELVLRG